MSSASVPSAVSGASDEAPPKFSAATTTTTFVNCDDGMSTKEGNGAADRDAFDKGSAVERVEPTPGDFGQRRAPWCPHPTPWADIIAQKYPGNGVEGDPFVVSYLPVGEREDPYTWGRGYKWVLTMMCEFKAAAISHNG